MSDTEKSAAATELYKQQVAEALDRRKEYLTARHESQVAIEAAQIDVSKGAIDRARDSAKYIQTAASAIAVLYTGVAGLIFKVDADRPLPVRGVIPILYLGAAIVFSSVYLSWFGKSGELRPFPVGIDASNMRVARVQWFSDWVSLTVLNKAWALRVATLTLAAGLLFLAAPFIPTKTVKSPSAEAAASATSKVAAAKPLQLTKATTATTSTTLPPWPTAPSRGNEFDQILYRAQVKEAAKAREAAAAKKSTATASSSWRIPELAIWVFALLVAATIAFSVYYQQTRGALRKAINVLTVKPVANDDDSSDDEAADASDPPCPPDVEPPS